MYKRSVTSASVRWSIVFLGFLAIIFVIILLLEARGFSRKDRAFMIWMAMLLATVGLLMFGIAIRQGQYAIIVDENGVRANIGRHKGSIPWDSVGEIGIIRTFGGERIVYIASERASPYMGGAALSFSKPSDDVIKVGYNRNLLEAIEQHYTGPIAGKKEAKADTKK